MCYAIKQQQVWQKANIHNRYDGAMGQGCKKEG